MSSCLYIQFLMGNPIFRSKISNFCVQNGKIRKNEIRNNSGSNFRIKFLLLPFLRCTPYSMNSLFIRSSSKFDKFWARIFGMRTAGLCSCCSAQPSGKTFPYAMPGANLFSEMHYGSIVLSTSFTFFVLQTRGC